MTVLLLHITCNVHYQIEHILAPTFMPPQLHIRPTFRYRYLYWCSSVLLVLFVLSKDRGETVVEQGWFVLLSLVVLLYAPFWLSNAIYDYQEHVQELEIQGINKAVL